jgi:hypothetical protein
MSTPEKYLRPEVIRQVARLDLRAGIIGLVEKIEKGSRSRKKSHRSCIVLVRVQPSGQGHH